MSREQPPSMGRIVFYAEPPHGPTRPAMITVVHDEQSGLVDLEVFGVAPYGETRLPQQVPFGDAETPHSWYWPPRV